MSTNSNYYFEYQMSHPFEEKWEFSKIYHGKMSYLEYGSNFEGKEDLEKGWSLRDESDSEDIHIYDNFYCTRTCFENFLLPQWECTTSCIGTKYHGDVESLIYYL
jgi:hypothetical protein